MYKNMIEIILRIDYKGSFFIFFVEWNHFAILYIVHRI